MTTRPASVEVALVRVGEGQRPETDVSGQKDLGFARQVVHLK